MQHNTYCHHYKRNVLHWCEDRPWNS